MRNRILLLAMGLALVATPAVAGNKIKTVPTEPVACEGVFGPTSSEAQVKEFFGAENVVTGTVYGPEGIEILATTAFPDDPDRRIQFVWWDEENLRYASYIELARNQETPAGVRIGQSVAEVQAINGAPFSINGFWWDYGGNAVFDKGALTNPESGCSFWVHFSPKDDYPPNLDVSTIAGEVTVPSSEPLLKELDVRVTGINLGYPWPDDLPQPQD